MIRDFEPRDQAAARSVIEAGMAERWGHDYDPSANADTRDLAATYTTAGDRLLVAESPDGHVIATGALVEQSPGVSRMVRISVDRGWRRMGVGRALVDALVRAARDRGSHSVVVSTDTPWTEAVALYRSCGFVTTHIDDTDTHLELTLAAQRGNPGLSFDQVPDLYDAVRPTYPPWFFDRLFELIPARPRVLEVGAGTGKATAALLERSARVTAIEPGPQLAAMLRSRFADFDHFAVVEDPFESADLPAASFDAVLSATAYHWIEATHQISRPTDLLAAGGVLGIIDLIQVGSPSDRGYFDRVQPIYESFGDVRHEWSPPTYESAVPPIAAAIAASDRFDAPTVLRCPWDQTYTSAAYRGLLLTYSGTRMMPAAERVSMVDQLVAVVDDEFGGVLTRPLVATFTLARRRSL